MARRKAKKSKRKAKRSKRVGVIPKAADKSPSMGGRTYTRLWSNVEQSTKDLQPHREERHEAVEQYVGSHFSDNGAAKEVPVNLIEMAVNIYVRYLAGKAPQVLASTQFRQLKPQASLLELAINHLVKEIDIESTFRKWVLNAMFGLSTVKVGLTSKGEVEIEGVLHDPGQPFADVVDLDDWVHDTTARTWEEIQFAGNRYRLPLEWVKTSGLYDRRGTKDLTSDPMDMMNEGGDERVEAITYDGTGRQYDNLKEYVELYDIWLPAENVVVTLPAKGNAIPLREVEWDGPERGPYHHLAFSDVPQSVMPLPPVAIWRDLHDLVNNLWRKLGRQAVRQKDVTTYAGAAHADAERLRTGDDGEMLRVDDPKSVQTQRLGGMDQSNFAFAIHAKSEFEWLAGNLGALGGLSPQADTLGQERLLRTSASERVSDMQDRTMTAAGKVLEDLGWYMWTDPLIDLPLVKRLPGSDFDIPVSFAAEDREGDFYQYTIALAPYSMRSRSPGDKLQTIQETLNMILPNAQQMAAQGIQINWTGVVKTIAKLTDTPELDDVLTMPGTVMPQQLGGEEAGMAPNTTRTNVRVNRPGATERGKNEALVQTLMGGGVNDDQMASIGRQTG